MRKIFFLGFFFLTFQTHADVHERGYWVGEDTLKEHQFDRALADAIARFFLCENAKSVADFGCGLGTYVRTLRASSIYAQGYDGNPDTPILSGGVAEVADLSQPLHLGKTFDWVLCLEVGEHIPKVYERIFLDNLDRHNAKGIVLSWAVQGQGGYGHFNEQNNDPIKELMAQYGYHNDLAAENEIRKCATLPWFKNTIMVFRKEPPINPLSAVSLTKHLKKIEASAQTPQVRNIDFIYLINLDQRPEKLARSIAQLAPYAIRPYRFPAIYGWDLSPNVFNDIGVQFIPGMKTHEWAFHFPLEGNGPPAEIYLNPDYYGMTIFSPWMTRGAIGCTLSHLSILQHAYRAGYETIWIMEDDIDVRENPHLISDLIDQLDALVGKNGWDILYTDAWDILYSDVYEYVPPKNGISGKLRWMWRPDQPAYTSTYAHREKMSKEFIKIGSRTRTHSMILRRSGIKKILDFEKRNHIFVPYDHEIAFIPGIKMFMLTFPLITWLETTTDTKERHF